YLTGIGLRAPRGGMFGVRQQILGAEWNALQRPAQTLALDIAFHVLGVAERVLAQRKRQRIVTRAERLQAIAERARQLHGGKFLLGEFLVDFGDAGEEDVVGNGAHGVAYGLNIMAGSVGAWGGDILARA